MFTSSFIIPFHAVGQDMIIFIQYYLCDLLVHPKLSLLYVTLHYSYGTRLVFHPLKFLSFMWENLRAYRLIRTNAIQGNLQVATSSLIVHESRQTQAHNTVCHCTVEDIFA
jgi:hypothetical protein